MSSRTFAGLQSTPADPVRLLLGRVAQLWAARDARTALDAVPGRAAITNPEVHRIAMALDAARRWDADLASAWHDRMRMRLARYQRLARWLARDRALGTGWTAREAAILLWTATSIATCDQLVVDMKLSVAADTPDARVDAAVDPAGADASVDSGPPRRRR